MEYSNGSNGTSNGAGFYHNEEEAMGHTEQAPQQQYAQPQYAPQPVPQYAPQMVVQQPPMGAYPQPQYAPQHYHQHPHQHVHQPQYMPPQQQQNLGVLGQLASMPTWAAVVIGAVGWAVLGDTIKSAFGLGKRAAAIGVDKAHKSLAKHEAAEDL